MGGVQVGDCRGHEMQGRRETRGARLVACASPLRENGGGWALSFHSVGGPKWAMILGNGVRRM